MTWPLGAHDRHLARGRERDAICAECRKDTTDCICPPPEPPRGCPPDCGGCACHIAPPCGHCTDHVEPDE